MDYRGNDIGQAKWVENQEACAKLSASNVRALYWTFMPPTDHPWSNLCWIKTSNAGRMAMSTVVSGNRECGIECKCYNWMPWNVATLPRMTHLQLHLLQLYLVIFCLNFLQPPTETLKQKLPQIVELKRTRSTPGTTCTRGRASRLGTWLGVPTSASRTTSASSGLSIQGEI